MRRINESNIDYFISYVKHIIIDRTIVKILVVLGISSQKCLKTTNK